MKMQQEMINYLNNNQDQISLYCANMAVSRLERMTETMPELEGAAAEFRGRRDELKNKIEAAQ